MDHSVIDPIIEDVVRPESPPTPAEETFAEGPAKPKGRRRLLNGFARIASSDSLPLRRKRAATSPYGNRGTLSCVSLGGHQTPLAYDQTFGFATAPGTPAQAATIVNAYGTRSNEGNSSSHPDSPYLGPLPLEVRSAARGGITALRKQTRSPESDNDYFSLPIPAKSVRVPNPNFDFWADMPHEIKLFIFGFLRPKELIRISIVSQSFKRLCYDGQLWTSFDASEFYREIPAESLGNIIKAAGPFVKNLNLRGCVQVEHYKRAQVVVDACKNLMQATLEGCKNFQRSTLHNLLRNNSKLAHLNLTGLNAVNNSTCVIIARQCPQLEVFNVSWCSHMDVKGIKAVVIGCPKLRDLRVGEVRGFSDLEAAQLIFETNNLERLVLSGCTDITDAALTTMIHGRNPEIDILTDRPLVPPRKLRHLDLSRCSRLSSIGVKALAHNVPYLEALHLSGCTLLTDSALEDLLSSVPNLTILDLEDLSLLTNTLLSTHLSKSPCAPRLSHLSISYCENLGDAGMLPVLRECTALQTIDMDNTRISDLVLAEAAAMVRRRSSIINTNISNAPYPYNTASSAPLPSRPRVTLRMVVYDCQNITWTGIREVLSRNAEIRKPTITTPINTPVTTTTTSSTTSAAGKRVHLTMTTPTYPTEVISLKCFYMWQMTVDKHMERVLGGDVAAAARLERSWAEWMVASEEAGALGAGIRRRRRRAREAALLHADEEEGGGGAGGGGGGGVFGAGGATGGVGRRRRARSSGCAVM